MNDCFLRAAHWIELDDRLLVDFSSLHHVVAGNEVDHLAADFLGLGVAIPMPSLGSLASDGLNGLTTYPYLLMAPALLIGLIILSFNLFGDGLRDAFDPKMKS